MLSFYNLKKGFKIGKANQQGKEDKGEELRKQDIEMLGMVHKRQIERQIYQEKLLRKKDEK